MLGNKGLRIFEWLWFGFLSTLIAGTFTFTIYMESLERNKSINNGHMQMVGYDKRP
jgi:hypothetical protein